MVCVMGYNVLIFSVFFSFTSILHGFFNSYYDKKRIENRIFLKLHYLSTFLFLSSVVYYAYEGFYSSYYDIFLISFLVFIVHSIRFVFDFLDLKRMPRFRDFVRPIADAAANLGIAVFAIVASNLRDEKIAWLAIFFSVMLILKELKYRIVDDFFLRKDGSVATSQGGEGTPSSDVMRGFHAFAGRFVKSFFYIILGFALLYMSLAVYEDDLWKALYGNSGGVPHLVSAVLFSFVFYSKPSVSNANFVAYIIGFIECGVGLFMAWVFRSLHMPKKF